MIFLVLAIICSSAINWIFKLFGKFQINEKTAIVFNYLTCSLIGQVMAQVFVFSDQSRSAEGYWFTLLLGILFIVIFYSMARTTFYYGISVNVVSAKMAMVVPSLFFVFYLHESFTWQIALALFLALLVVVLTNFKGLKHMRQNGKFWFPFLVFFGSGIIDTCMKWIDLKFLNGASPLAAATQIFTGAFLVGFLWLLFSKNKRFSTKDILAGIALGIPNFFSIFFLLKGIQMLNTWTATSIFTTNNSAVILLSTLGGILFFKDKLNNLQWLGLLLSIVSIILLQYVV